MNRKHKLTARLYEVSYKYGAYHKGKVLDVRQEHFLNIYNAHYRKHDYEFEMNYDLSEDKETRNKQWFVEIEELAA